MINGGESGLGGSVGIVGTVDPLDVYCGGNICNAKADGNANSCVIGVPSTVVGEKLLILHRF